MIDFHCHILPNIDDDTDSLKKSMWIAQQAFNKGVHKIVATPQLREDNIHTGKHIIGIVDYLNGKLREEQIQVEILPGEEVRIYGDLLKDAQNGNISGVNALGRYLFIDLPPNEIPRYTTQLLFDLQIAGYNPVIVRPEKNKALLKKPDLLYQMVKGGIITQIEAASVMGKSGREAQKFAHELIGSHLTHLVATGSYTSKRKSIHLGSAYRVIEKRFGKATVHELRENSEAVMNGKSVAREMPSRFTKKKRIWNVLRI